MGETPKMIEKEIMHKFKLFYYIYIKSYGIIKPKRILIWKLKFYFIENILYFNIFKINVHHIFNKKKYFEIYTIGYWQYFTKIRFY